MAGHWLLKKIQYAAEVQESSTKALAQLHTLPNPHTGSTNYSNVFFEQQWADEQAYHVNTNRTSDWQQVELGRLLCLKEDLNDAW